MILTMLTMLKKSSNARNVDNVGKDGFSGFWKHHPILHHESKTWPRIWLVTDYLDEHAETEGEGDEDDEPGEGEEDPAAHADAVARVLLRWRGGRSS